MHYPSPAMSAGLLVLTLPILDQIGIPRPTVRDALATLGVSTAQAYDRRARLCRALPDLEPRNGRRPRPRPTVVQTNQLTREVLDFLLEHPGAARRARGHTRYTTAWRHFAIELVESHPEHSHAALAEALSVPLSTLERWLATGEVREGREPEPTGDGEPTAGFEAVLESWDGWRGDFTGFCEHVRRDLGLPWGPRLIGDILFVEGKRKRRRRKRTGEATRGQYRTHFPGAQWGADGTKISVTVGEEAFTFNLELVVDVDSAALVGGELSAQEDGDALLSALDDAHRTTDERPLALVLDESAPCPSWRCRVPIPRWSPVPWRGP